MRIPQLLVDMVHKHSPEALARRRARAYERGYLCAVPRPGCSWMSIRSDLRSATCQIAKSLAIHVDHDSLVETHHHYARDATLAAKHAIPADEFSDAMAAHKFANAAKHEISSRQSTDSEFAMNELLKSQKQSVLLTQAGV